MSLHRYIAFTTAGLTFLVVSLLQGNEAPEITNVKIRWIEAEKFYRISEFFTGRENTGNRIILRTTEERGGVYFMVYFQEDVNDLPSLQSISLEVLSPINEEISRFDFQLPDERKQTRLIFIGLTGNEWKIPMNIPVAWRIIASDEGGQEITDYKSFLWEFPEDA